VRQGFELGRQKEKDTCPSLTLAVDHEILGPRRWEHFAEGQQLVADNLTVINGYGVSEKDKPGFRPVPVTSPLQ